MLITGSLRSRKKMHQAFESKVTELELIAFSLSECLVDVEEDSAKYLRAVHRTALELAVPNCFGIDIGGFWLMANQLAELRRLPDFYPRHEAPLVTRAVEAYINAQTESVCELCPKSCLLTGRN